MNKLFFFSIALMSLSACVSEGKHIDNNEKSEPTKNEYAQTVANFSSENPITWTATLDNPYFNTSSGKKSVYLYIELKGKESQEQTKRPPLNLSLVLDKSGSMRGDKLANAKKAMDFVVDQLDESDYLSIVQYGTDVNVVHPSKEVTSKSLLHSKIRDIVEQGSTNLCGGLQEGYEQARSTKKEGFVNRVLLLSDGLVNVGITNPDQIKNIAQSAFKDKGIATSTFGVGADYNENLMTDIADHAGANYYFIGEPKDIEGIFSKELKGLLSVVAQQTMLKVRIPNQNFKVTKVYGYPHTMFGDEVLIDLNDVFSKEEKAILIELEMTNIPQNNLVFDCELKYLDAASQSAMRTENKQIRLQMTNNKDLYERSFDENVKENIVLFRSTEMFDQALEEADHGNYDKAKEISTQTKDYLNKNVAEKPSVRFKNQVGTVNAYDSAVTTMPAKTETEQKMMQKAGKSANYETKKAK